MNLVHVESAGRCIGGLGINHLVARPFDTVEGNGFLAPHLIVVALTETLVVCLEARDVLHLVRIVDIVGVFGI